MKYVEPKKLTRSEAERLLADKSVDVVTETLVSVAFYEPDWRWVQEKCLVALRSEQSAIRHVAATCLGHVARIHHTLDVSTVRPILDALVNDPDCGPYALAAIEDIEMFVRPEES